MHPTSATPLVGCSRGSAARLVGDARLDLILANARLADPFDGDPVDIGIAGGRIVAIGHGWRQAPTPLRWMPAGV